jgi:hypothetical protein
MFTPIQLEPKKNVARFKGMQVGEVREFGTYTKAQATSMLRARMRKHIHEIYTLDTSSIPLKFRRDA